MRQLISCWVAYCPPLRMSQPVASPERYLEDVRFARLRALLLTPRAARPLDLRQLLVREPEPLALELPSVVRLSGLEASGPTRRDTRGHHLFRLGDGPLH